MFPRMKHLFPIVLFVLGCGNSANSGPVYRFSPGSELAESAVDALASIETASGIPTDIGSGGVEVRWATPADLLDPDDCANTLITFSKSTRKTTNIVIFIRQDHDIDCGGDGEFALARTIQHEMIHALRSWDTNPDEPNQGHSEHGVFQAHVIPEDRLLEETSLQAICDRVECSVFSPEGK